MREVPRRERVGREALVHERQRRHDARILQILVVGADLVREQHALVDDGARRHRRHVELLAVRQLQRLDRVAGALADDVELALERIGHRDPAAAADEYLADHRLDLADRLAEVRVVARHVAPAEQELAFVLDRALDLVFAGEPRSRFARQEHHADAVLARRRQLDVLARHFFAQEGVRHLDQDAGAVARQRIGADGAAVRQVLQYLQPLLDDGVGFFALDVRDEADAAGVVLVGGIVKTLGKGRLVHGLPR